MSQRVTMLRGAVVVCALAIVGAGAAHFSSSHEQKPDKFKDVEGCYISALDKVLPKGETEASTECTLYSCEDQWYDSFTCLLVAGEPPCKTVTDASKPYPDCCPRVECPEPETTEK